MKNDIQIFNHSMFGSVRTMTNERGETFFVGKDVAKALGYSKPENAIATHVDREDKTTTLIQGTGSNYKSKTTIINESGLYSLVLASKLPQAKAFKRWVTSEVLPQIRQTGGYIPLHDKKGRMLTQDEIMQEACTIVQNSLIKVNKPNEKCLTATEVAKMWGMQVKDLNRILCKLNIQYWKDKRYNLNREYEDLRLTEDRTFMGYSLMGEPKTRTYMTWTPTGVKFLEEVISRLHRIA